MANLNRLAGKSALITGASRGIGRAIADRFIREGAQVVACGRGDRPEDLITEVEWIQADVTSTDDVARLVRDAGYIDTLVNNAGVQVEKTVLDSTDDDWDLVMGVNARGVFNCSRAFIPGMIAQGGGAIINIGSVSGQAADPGMALYNASKAFVHGLTRSIAVDHGPVGIRCNAICPGWIMTGMADAAFEMSINPAAAKNDAIARHPVGRMGQPEDIAAMAVWLASDEAMFASGQLFTVDGGLTAASPMRPELF